MILAPEVKLVAFTALSYALIHTEYANDPTTNMLLCE